MDRLIQPGKSEPIKISMSAGPRAGELKRGIEILSNDREHGTVSVECSAQVLSALKFEPATLDLGSIRRTDSAILKAIRITRGSDQPIRPKLVDTGTPQITAELREIHPEIAYDLLIRCQPPWPMTNIRANVRLETGVEQSSMENVIVTATVIPRVQADPARFVVKPSPREEHFTARLVWDDDQPSKIAAVTASDSALHANVQEQDGHEVVVLDVPVGYVLPRGQGVQVKVEIDDPTMPVLQIPVQSTIGRSTARSVAPAKRKIGRPVYPAHRAPGAR